jgi:hypothetical protein
MQELGEGCGISTELVWGLEKAGLKDAGTELRLMFSTCRSLAPVLIEVLVQNGATRTEAMMWLNDSSRFISLDISRTVSAHTHTRARIYTHARTHPALVNGK